MNDPAANYRVSIVIERCKLAYGSDIDLVQKTLLEIEENNRKVLKYPRPDVLFINHADSALIFRLRIWFHVDDYWDVCWDVTRTVKLRFDEEGISIPFPSEIFTSERSPGRCHPSPLPGIRTGYRQVRNRRCRNLLEEIDSTSGQLRLTQYTNEIWQTGKLKRWKVHAYGQAGDVYLSFTIMKKS